MDYKKYKYCPHLINYQCSFQVGDCEDISEEEMKLECRHYKKCPYSDYNRHKDKKEEVEK